MGLLSRFRQTSSSHAGPASTPQLDAKPSSRKESQNTRPTTPTPNLVSHEELVPPTALLRSSAPSPSPSSSSRSRVPWKRHASSSGFAGAGNGLGHDASKGKAKTNGPIGLAYEDTSPGLDPPRPFAIHGHSFSAPNSPHVRSRSSDYLADTAPVQFTSAFTSHVTEYPTRDPPKENGGQEERQAMVSSGQFRQEGGILGKLEFEFDSLGLSTSPPSDWVEPRNVQTAIPVVPAESLSQTATGVPGPPAPKQEQATAARDPNTIADSQQADTSTSHVREDVEEQMEVLELVEPSDGPSEKKAKFWRRPRRHSRSVSEVPDMPRPTSPTMCKQPETSGPADHPAARSSVDVQLPRPQQLRRPSSSLFHNPFNRSASRVTSGIDLDIPSVDDGSFQLRGFRHVSGMMEVEGAGELENYLAHVRKDPRSSTSVDLVASPVSSDVALSGPAAALSPASAASPKLLPPKALSRPPSIANSLASAGDDLTTPANRVSVAAFRRGIRRPSEGLTTMSDLGHGAPTSMALRAAQAEGHAKRDENDSGEDDMPLAMISKRNALHKQKSAQSLATSTEPLWSPMAGEVIPDAASGTRSMASPSPSETSRDPPSRKVSPGPPANTGIQRPGSSAASSFAVQRHKRNGDGSGGFVVRSGRLNPDEQLNTSVKSASLQPLSWTPPPTSGATTPLSFASSHLTSSPAAMPTVGGYFDVPSPVGPTAMSDGESHVAKPAPGPPVQPVGIPQPGQETPIEIEEKPLIVATTVVPSVHGATGHASEAPEATQPLSPGHRKRLSLLDEPLRIISGFWNQPAGPEIPEPEPEKIEGEQRSHSPHYLVNDDSPGELAHQPSHTTLFDVGKITPGSEDRTRSPLSERLAGVTANALGNVIAKPPLAPLNTEEHDGSVIDHAAERVKSPMSDSTLSPTMTAVPPPKRSTSPAAARTAYASSFARVKPRRQAQAPSSEDSDTEVTTDAQTHDGAALKGKSAGPMPLSPNRKVPFGPRKPSVAGRKRVSSVQSSDIVSGSRQPSAASSSMPAADSESEDNEPLGVLRNKASRSSLAIDHQQMGSAASSQHPALPRSVSGLSSRAGTSNQSVSQLVSPQGMLSPETRRKTLGELGPVSEPLRDRSAEPHQPRSRSHSRARPPSRSHGTSPSFSSTSQGISAGIGNNRTGRSPNSTLVNPPEIASPPGQMYRKTASPDSSRSATTGGSGAYQPMTPKESSEASDAMVGGSVKQASWAARNDQRGFVPPQEQRKRVSSAIGMAHPPTQWSPIDGAVQPGASGPVHVDQQMTPEAMHAMMKQQWQMQFMAAAYRASEDEWERQSAVSTHTAQTVPMGYNQTTNMAPQHMGWNPAMGMMQYPGMPYGYSNGYQQGQQAYGYMYPAAGGYGYHMAPTSPLRATAGLGGGMGGGGGGMYSYGTGAQSVYGGGFGPAPTLHPAYPAAGSLDMLHYGQSHSQSFSTSGGSQYGGRATSTYSPSGPTQGAAPPSAWNGRAGSGDWANLSRDRDRGETPGRGGRTPSQYAN
ncbi:hypothetical protein IAU60_004656 [Kwoniella sp. DSM 27419]